MTNVLFIYMLCLSWREATGVFSSRPCNLEVSNLHKERKLECLEYSEGCRPDDQIQVVPDNFQMSVEKPATIFATSYLKEGPDEWYANLNITWTPPKSATALRNLKGFLLRISSPELKPSIDCRLFMMEDGLMPNDKGALFQYTVDKVKDFTTYFIVIWSLPRSGENFEMAQTIQVATPSMSDYHDYDHDPRSSAVWTTYIIFRVVNNDEVQVTFNFGEFKMEKFIVDLIEEDLVDKDMFTCSKTVLKSQSKDPTHGKVSFKDVEAGTYLIQVTPQDPFRNERQLCLCFMMEGESRECEICTTSQTALFNVPGKQVKTTAASQNTFNVPGKQVKTTAASQNTFNVPGKQVKTTAASQNTFNLPGKQMKTTAASQNTFNLPGKQMKTTAASQNTFNVPGKQVKTTAASQNTFNLPGKQMKTTGASLEDDKLMSLNTTTTPGPDEEMESEIIAPKGTGKNSEEMVVIVLVFFVCVIVFGSISILLWKAHMQSANRTTANPVIEMGTMSQDPADTRKSILVLNADDHCHHLEVIKELLNILDQYCGLSVIYPPRHINQICRVNWKKWIVQCLDSVDFVLLVTSEAAAKLIQASLRRDTYNIQQLTETGHLYVPMLRQVLKASSKELTLDKYITVSFSYTPREYTTITGLPTPHHFTLVDGLRDFLCFMKNLSGSSVAATASDENNFTNLQYSVLRAARYESCHVHWFSERFGYPYQQSYNRLDSGYHSLAPLRINNISESSSPENQLEKEDETDELGFYPPEEELERVVFYNIPPDDSNVDCMSLSVSIQLRQINDNYENSAY
ncbi:hypothetical protein LOTGIDRAFT_231928 [Lottia gigantea]|uniref:Uncharacterized protein n=1 Tax=Lottia gigantea TaxID=225164 RepID=V4AFQ5_LOTGI|nr:hypothetical protein LOTGIDRAFT_231928 [Lottia gigantea]ESO95727.1 hypothetical protein LOTGIDRAFT_231928 [Lottia gigantea]